MKFNNEFYNQVKGTAMGTIVAPTYAIYRWDILKSNFILSALLSIESFQLSISSKTGTAFWMTTIQF